MQIANNLLDGVILARDGATATLSDNVPSASPAMFVNPSAGDLHLAPGATSAIDRVAVPANVPTDWDGHARAGGADAGADEFASSVLPSTPQNLRIVY